MRRLSFGGLVLASMISSVSFGAIIDFKNVTNGLHSTGNQTTSVILTPSGGGSLNTQTDNNYALIHLPTGCSGISCQETNTSGDLFGPATYVVLGGNGTYPLNGVAWVRPDDANSSWIGPRANQRTPASNGTQYDNVSIFGSNSDFYVYRTVFNLAALGIDPTTVSISLGWLSDDTNAGNGIRMCAISNPNDPVCGGSNLALSGNSGQGSPTLSTVNITTGFTSGLMALDFIVFNSAGIGNNPSGLNVSILSATGSTPAGVPEPATFTFMAAGLIGIGLFARRKR